MSALSSSSSTMAKAPKLKPPLTATLKFHHHVFKNEVAQLIDALKVNSAAIAQWIANNKSNKHPLAPKTPLLDVNSQDRYGNTPIMLAVMMGHRDCVSALIDFGSASLEVRNAAGWKLMQEAVSYGDRDVIKLICKALHSSKMSELDSKMTDIMEKFKLIPNFTIQIGWNFSTWIPLLTRLLPYDTWTIYKRDTFIRIDMTLDGGFNARAMSFTRGSLSFIFELVPPKVAGLMTKAKKATVKIVALDHVKKVYSPLTNDSKDSDESESESSQTFALDDEDLEEMVDDFMSTPLTDISSPGAVKFERAQSGIWPWRGDRSDTINSLSCRVYNVSNMNILTQKRYEHLTDEEVAMHEKKSILNHNGKELEAELEEEEQKRIAEEMAALQVAAAAPNGSSDTTIVTTTNGNPILIVEAPPVTHRESLPPPPAPRITFEQYFGPNGHTPRLYVPILPNQAPPPVEIEEITLSEGAAEVKQTSITEVSTPAAASAHWDACPKLGRDNQLKATKRSFTGTVWMTDEFPLSTDTVVGILDMIAPRQRHVAKVKNFIMNRLPPGFPLKLSVSVFPTITVTVTFMNYSDANIPEDKMRVPDDYILDKDRFELFSKQTEDEE